MKQENIALILPIDEDKIVSVNGTKYNRYFEEELIRCVKSWRKNGGWLKDINIYILHSNDSSIKEDTIRSLLDMNVIYIDDFNNDSVNFINGFLNEPYCGKYFEKIKPIKEEITIKLDLDMQLLKPIPKNIIEMSNEKIIIGQYDEKSVKNQRDFYFEQLPFDTNLIITNRKFNFYEKYYDMCFSDVILNNDHYKNIQKIYGNYYLEEFVVDYLNKNIFDNILPIKYYQYGEGYPSISEYPIEEIENIYFLHEHIYKNNKFPYNYNPIKERMNYLKFSR